MHSVIKRQLFISSSQRSRISYSSRYCTLSGNLILHNFLCRKARDQEFYSRYTAFLYFYSLHPFYVEKPNATDVQGEIIYVCPADNIMCLAVGPPLPTVTWKRHNKQLTSGRGSTTLQISSIIPHEGAYSCHAENQFGTDENRVILLNALCFIDRPPKTLHLEVGAKAEVHCSAALGGMSADVSWSLPKCFSCNSKYQSSARNIGNGTLRFVSAKIWDSGVYHCTVKAKGATRTAKVKIYVGNQPTGNTI